MEWKFFQRFCHLARARDRFRVALLLTRVITTRVSFTCFTFASFSLANRRTRARVIFFKVELDIWYTGS